MPYIERNQAGAINGVYALSQPGYAEEFLAEDAAEVLAFFAPPPVAKDVKAEAYRRIIAICPEWKQRNLTAQATQLLRKGEANWTQDEAAAWAAGQAIWEQIAEIRAASDTIEAMDPIPTDYDDDSYWP